MPTGEPMRCRWRPARRIAGTTTLVLLAAATAARAQDPPVPSDLQYTLLAKVLTYDRNLRSRAGDELVIAVVYQESFPASNAAMKAFEDAYAGSRFHAIDVMPIRIVSIALRDLDRLEKQLREKQADVVYLAPLRAVAPEAVAHAATRAGALTVTGVPEYVSQGAAVGFGLEAGRPKVLIDAVLAREQGADFSSRLLAMAELVRKGP